MLTSWQIAQLHAQQSQTLGAMGSHQLSTLMPGPYMGHGLGATGMSGSFSPGGGYNYGLSPFVGYAAGNSFGNTMSSMVGGGIYAMGGAGKYIGGGLGLMMGGIRGAITGYGVGGLVGGAIQHIGSSMMEGAHEQAALERTLSQFKFANPSSRSGTGFNRIDARQIGDMVRQMERIPEMLTSFGELNRVMDKMGQMGLMQGVRDASEFMNKFRSTVSTLKDLAKVMGTTMEGALQTFGEARMSGFYGTGDIARNALNRQITSSLTGMNQGQIGAIQQYGSQLSHAMGGSRRTGAQHMLRTSSQLGMANQMGILSNDMIMEMTGKEGAEGLQDLSVQMTELGYRMGRSNVGQALTLALGEKVNGRYTGRMDQALVDAVRSGEISLGELKQLARRKAGGRGSKLSFAAHKQRLRAEMVGAVGAEGIAMELQEILGNRGWHNPDAINLVMQRFGASEEQANLMQTLMPNLQNITSEIGILGRDQSKLAARNAAMREHGWDAIKHRIGKKLEHYTTDWAKDMGVSVRSYFQSWADDFIDDISGQYRTYVTKSFADTLRNSMGGSLAARSRLGSMMALGGSLASGLGPSRLDIGASGGMSGFAARAAHSLSGGTSAGENAVSILNMVGHGRYLRETTTGGWGYNLGMKSVTDWSSALQASAGDVAAQSGDVVLSRSSGFVNDTAYSLSVRGLTSASFDLSRWDTDAVGSKMFSNLGKAVGSDVQAKLVAAYRKAMSDPSVLSENDQGKRMMKIWSLMKNSGELTFGSKEALQKSGWGGQASLIAALQANERAAGNKWAGLASLSSVADILTGLDINNKGGIDTEIKELSSRLADNLKGSDKSLGWLDLKSMADSGDTTLNLLTGFNGNNGALGGNGVDVAFGNASGKGGSKWGGWGADGIMQLLALDPSSWENDENIKSTLRDKFGVEPADLIKRLRNPEERTKLLGLIRGGKANAKDLERYMLLTWRSGGLASAESFQGVGKSIADRIAGSNSAAADALSKSSSGNAVLTMIKDRAKNLQGVTADNIASYTDNSYQIAMGMRGLSKEDRAYAGGLVDESVKAAGGIIDDAYGKYTTGVGKGRRLRKGKGMNLDALLSGLGIQLGTGNQDMELRNQVGGILGKDGLSDMGELNKVIEFLGNRQGKGLIKEGTATNSKHVSEQEVANNLKALSDNNVKIVTILGNIASGKTGAAITEGVVDKP